MRLRKCFLFLLAVMEFRISLSISLTMDNGGKTRWLWRTLFLCFQNWYTMHWAASFFNNEEAATEEDRIQERSSYQLLKDWVMGLRCEMDKHQPTLLKSQVRSRWSRVSTWAEQRQQVVGIWIPQDASLDLVSNPHFKIVSWNSSFEPNQGSCSLFWCRQSQVLPLFCRIEAWSFTCGGYPNILIQISWKGRARDTGEIDLEFQCLIRSWQGNRPASGRAGVWNRTVQGNSKLRRTPLSEIGYELTKRGPNIVPETGRLVVS